MTGLLIQDWVGIIFIIIGVLYFIPSIVAKRNKNFRSVLVINIFLGWTFIGWVVSLVMAAGEVKKELI